MGSALGHSSYLSEDRQHLDPWVSPLGKEFPSGAEDAADGRTNQGVLQHVTGWAEIRAALARFASAPIRMDFSHPEADAAANQGSHANSNPYMRLANPSQLGGVRAGQVLPACGADSPPTRCQAIH